MAREMHPSQPQILNRAHPEMLLATISNRAFRCVRRGADFREVQGSVMLRREQFLEFRHNQRMVTNAAACFSALAVGQAPNHDSRQRFLERSADLGVQKDVRRGRNEAPSDRMQPPQSGEEVTARPYVMCLRGRKKLPTDQRAGSICQLVRSKRHCTKTASCRRSV